MTFAGLRHLNIAAIETAAHDWRATAKTLSATGDDATAGAYLPLKRSWKGPAADKATAQVKYLTGSVDDGAQQAFLISRALTAAASRWRVLQDRLHQLIEDAQRHGLVISDTGVSVPAMSHAERHYDTNVEHRRALATAAGLLRQRVAEILKAADELDASTAKAMYSLASVMRGPGSVDNARMVAELDGVNATSLPSPGNPKLAAQWWAALSEDDKQLLIQAYPKEIGFMDGLPAIDRDTANRISLEQAMYAPRDRESHAAMQALQRRLDEADLGRPGQMLLLGFDPSGDGKAIVAIGNPDTARHTAIFVPGLETDLGDMPGTINRADYLATSADRMTPDAAGDVSVIAWLGYDAPETDLSVIRSDRSREGGAALDGFVNGLNTAHDGSPSHVTAIGHSYGSTVVGEAAKTGDGLAVGDIITAGSPGMHVGNASELHVGARHVWAGSAADDPVSNPGGHAGITGTIAGILGSPVLAPFVPGMEDSLHGPSPHYDYFGANRFQVDTSGHSAYWQPDSLSLKNQAAIIVGAYSRVTLDHGAVP